MEKDNVNSELIQRARNANLAEYFQSSGYECELRRNELHVKGYGGLFVNTQTNEWYCFSQSGSTHGGKNAINCLTDVIGLDFKTAVEELAQSRFSYEKSHANSSFSERKPEEKKELILPEKADNMKRVFAYLCQSRKINTEIISQLAHDGLLYQDKKGNAVFVHKDESEKIIGAEIQGTSTYQRFKGVASGTKDSVFSVKIGEPTKVYVFESAIDLLSFKQLANQDKIQNSLLVSMAGLKPNSIKSFAENGLRMYSCVDNDEAGIKFTEQNNLLPCRKILEQQNVKDYNELLQKFAPKTPQITQEFEKKSSHSRR